MEYNKKIREKTNKGYTQIEIEYDDVKGGKKADKKKEKKNTKKQDSKLHNSVQDLLKFIFWYEVDWEECSQSWLQCQETTSRKTIKEHNNGGI